MKNILIHGFNVRDPHKSVGKIVKYISNAFMFNYGWRGLINVLFTNKSTATELYRMNKGKTVNIIAHSNGGAVAVEAARQGLQINTLVLLMPALKRDTIFPENIKTIYVLYTKHDVPTRVARFFDKVPFFQLFIPNSWGAMGAKGAKELNRTADTRVFNMAAHDCDGHSDIFVHPNSTKYGKMIGQLTNEE